MSNCGPVQRKLQERLSQLLRQVERIEGDLRSAHDHDWPERATELQNDEVLERLDEIGLTEVRQIRSALKHIEAGQYGVCAACGQSIGAARLTAFPTAITCVQCALQ